jgi:LPS O-antigen subunit length determinant protein (WzzB/FepE family)
MKFRTKTEMQYLPFDQLVKASEQGGMIGVTVKGVTYGQQETSAYRTDDEPEPVDRSPLRKASVVLGLGVGALIGAGILMRARRRSNGALSEPLVPSSGMIA